MGAGGVTKNFCTTREAAGMLGVATSTVQLWVEAGLLKAWKTTGGHRRVVRDSVHALIERRNPIQATGEPSPSELMLATKPLRVMVVEDDRSLLRLYRAMLQSWPFATELHMYDNAVSALVAMGRSVPDLLVTDLHMPGMDGFAMLRVLHQIPEFLRTRVVVVTGLDPDQISSRGGLPVGIQVLSKPIPFESLRGMAAELVRGRLSDDAAGGT